MIIQLILIQLSTFAILIFVLRFLFYRHLAYSLKRLKEVKEETEMRQAQLRDEVERAKLDYTAEVEKGKQQAKTIIASAKKEAEILMQRIQDEAYGERDRIISHGKDDIEHLRQKILQDVSGEAVYYAQEMVCAIFDQGKRMGLHRQFISEVVDDIEKLNKESFSIACENIKIVSAIALTAEERNRLVKVFTSKMNCAVKLQEELSPDIIAGLLINVGELVIDGSLKNKLEKAVVIIKKQKR